MRNKLTPTSERRRSATGLADRRAKKLSRGHGYAPGVRPGPPGGRSSGEAGSVRRAANCRAAAACPRADLDAGRVGRLALAAV
eukprot:5145752-Alexandrium_andersonii.AAC.1